MNDGASVALGSLVTAVVGGLCLLLQTWRKDRREDRKNKVDEWETLIARQGQQIDRLELHVVEQQKTIGLLHDEHADCQVEVAHLYGEMVRHHDLMLRMAASLQRLGENVGELPLLPPRPQRHSGPDAGFAARSSEQATVLAQAIDARLQPGTAKPAP